MRNVNGRSRCYWVVPRPRWSRQQRGSGAPGNNPGCFEFFIKMSSTWLNCDESKRRSQREAKKDEDSKPTWAAISLIESYFLRTGKFLASQRWSKHSSATLHFCWRPIKIMNWDGSGTMKANKGCGYWWLISIRSVVTLLVIACAQILDAQVFSGEKSKHVLIAWISLKIVNQTGRK